MDSVYHSADGYGPRHGCPNSESRPYPCVATNNCLQLGFCPGFSSSDLRQGVGVIDPGPETNQHIREEAGLCTVFTKTVQNQCTLAQGHVKPNSGLSKPSIITNNGRGNSPSSVHYFHLLSYTTGTEHHDTQRKSILFSKRHFLHKVNLRALCCRIR